MRKNVDGNWEDYQKRYESSFRHPECPVSESAIGKLVKDYYDHKDEEKDLRLF